MAGILDFLTGGGSQGGLLDFLRANALNQQMPGGLPSDTATYGASQPLQMPQGTPVSPPMSFAGPVAANQPSPLDNAQWPAGPVGAPSNANAAMPARAPMSFAPPANPPPVIAAADTAQAAQSAPALAAPAAPAAPDNRLSLGMKGFLGNLAGGPLGAIAGGLGAVITGQPTDTGSIDRQKLVEKQRALISGLQAHGVSNADITAALANPEYMKKILDNSVKEKETIRPATPEERKAAFGGNDNGMPLYMNDETGKPTFGPAQTNVNVSTEKTGQAELATLSVKSYAEAQAAARESQKRLAMYDAFDKAAQGFTPGATAEMRLTAKRYLKDAGLIKGDDVPDGEIQQMIGRQLAIHAQPKGQGAVSNYERQLYASSLPSMIQSPEGLRQAISINRKLEQFDQNVAQIYRDSARANKGLPNYLDVQDKIAALGSPLSDGDMASIQPNGAPAASATTAPAAPTVARPPGNYVWTPGKGISK